METILSKKDLEDLEILIRITKTIDNLYYQLYELEAKNAKDSQEYKKLLANLILSVEVENDKYEELNLTYERCDAILEYLSEEKLPQGLLNDISSIVNEDYSNRIFRRIGRFIKRKIMLTYPENLLSLDLLEVFQKLDNLSLGPKAITQTIWQTNFQEAFEIDLYSLYLYFLDKEIKMSDDTSIKERLLASKYNVSMLDKDIEKNMFRSKFDINCPSYFCLDYCKDINDISDFHFATYKKNEAEKYISASINGLLNIKDSLFQTFKFNIMQLIIKSILRSTMVISDEEVIEEIKHSFMENLQDPSFYKDNPESYIAIEIVKLAFLNASKDKEEVITKMQNYNSGIYKC